ncbi:MULTISPECIES: type II secretion system minor pseudopilin GspJ [Alteromonadaceae]|jgi:general secretion pathway protein J|uniref:Type II secretion system protein J n=1 Tax=Brumicola blandensis TaxID=3075611 RepID=A0AAW8R2U7_9ALTE|nr:MULTISPECIES: type II secretion system minor pseudopilin GspJ [unclassified Alteromonas]MDT0583651.1 type II secretion system minor pseudopilin GspJ [Alteromonas sp. W409]MDT0629224.1 type II secretion system minor pseudopilin GspJ [Alteromonas sp. W364]
MHSLRSTQSGFTLLEVLIAMAIFALIAFGATQILTNVTDADEASEERFQSLQDLQRAMLVIERDFLQMVPRKTRVEGEVTDTLIFAEEFLFDSDSGAIGFVRAGWHNPQLVLPRSTMQSVAYRVSEERLERLYSTYVDNSIGFEPKVRVLLEGVEKIEFEFLEKFDTKEFTWEEAESVQELPIAVAVIITSKLYGEIRREFKVRR